MTGRIQALHTSKSLNFLFLCLFAISTVKLNAQSATATVTGSGSQGVTQNEKQFSDYVAQRAKAIRDAQTAGGKRARRDSSVCVIQKNVSVSCPLPAGFDSTKVFSVTLNIGLTRGGAESFTDQFTLNRNTPRHAGSAFYISNNQLNFQITTRAIANENLYYTILFAGSGQNNSYETVQLITK